MRGQYNTMVPLALMPVEILDTEAVCVNVVLVMEVSDVPPAQIGVILAFVRMASGVDAIEIAGALEEEEEEKKYGSTVAGKVCVVVVVVEEAAGEMVVVVTGKKLVQHFVVGGNVVDSLDNMGNNVDIEATVLGKEGEVVVAAWIGVGLLDKNDNKDLDIHSEVEEQQQL